MTSSEEGPTGAPFEMTIELGKIREFATATKSKNPEYLERDEFAQRSGFPTPFAVGMLQAVILASRLTDRFGAAAIRRLKVQWKEQAWPGDVLTYRAVVADLREENGQRLVDLEATVTRQTGGVHLQGSATVVVA